MEECPDPAVRSRLGSVMLAQQAHMRRGKKKVMAPVSAETFLPARRSLQRLCRILSNVHDHASQHVSGCSHAATCATL